MIFEFKETVTRYINYDSSGRCNYCQFQKRYKEVGAGHDLFLCSLFKRELQVDIENQKQGFSLAVPGVVPIRAFMLPECKKFVGFKEGNENE